MAEYIEREAVMKTAKNGNHSDFGRSMADLTSLREVLEDTPAADVVEVVHSKWVETYKPLGFDEVKCAECSSCGEDWIMDDDVCIDDYKAHWKYCPCCGAKMDGKENGNNGN